MSFSLIGLYAGIERQGLVFNALAPGKIVKGFSFRFLRCPKL